MEGCAFQMALKQSMLPSQTATMHASSRFAAPARLEQSQVRGSLPGNDCAFLVARFGVQGLHLRFSAPAKADGLTFEEQLLHRNVQRFRGGLVFKAHRLLYHSTLGLRVIKKKKMVDIRVSGFENARLSGFKLRSSDSHDARQRQIGRPL